jgi:hypothetical protein
MKKQLRSREAERFRCPKLFQTINRVQARVPFDQQAAQRLDAIDSLE